MAGDQARSTRVLPRVVSATHRLYRRLGAATARDVPPMVWELRHYGHFCQNCPGWPDGPQTQWRFTHASTELVRCQACVGLARMNVCDAASEASP